MGQWVNNHLSPTRYAYEFLNDYEQINGSSSLNVSGSQTIEFTITPKEGQLNCALFFKGDLTKNPKQNKQGHTVFVWNEGGYCRFKFFGTEATVGYGYEYISLNPVYTGVDVVYTAIVLNFATQQILLYINGVVEPIQIIPDGTGGFQTTGSIGDMGTSIFPSVFNNATSNIYFGKALGYFQFEGIIHDKAYHSKAKTSQEITSTWNQVKNPSPLNLLNIVFTSTRATSPARERIWKMNEKGGNQVLFMSQTYSLSRPRVNKSNNPLLDKTKLSVTNLGNNGITIMNVDGGLPVVSFSGTNAVNPDLSYDLTKVCYSFSSSGNLQIFIADFNSTTNQISNPIQLTTYSGNGNFTHHSPSFSPDGTKVIFRRIDGSGNEFLSRIDITGSNLIDLISGNSSEDFYDQIYSKDGTKIGYSQRQYMGGTFQYKYQVFTMDSSGGNVKRLTGEFFDNIFCDFSPDGNNIVYRQSFTSGDMVWRMDNNGRNKLNLSSLFYAGYSDYHGSWY